MSVSAIYILDLKGKVLLCRNYRGDIDMSMIDKFMPLLMEKEEESNLYPIIQVMLSILICHPLCIMSLVCRRLDR